MRDTEKIFSKNKDNKEQMQVSPEHKTCCIFGAGDYGEIDFGAMDDCLIIAADAGYNELKRRGIKPDLVVGDFDSLGSPPEGVEILRHPVMKDETDTHLAVDEGLRRGCTLFKIYGALGGRLDHTIGNIQLLTRLANRGVPGFIFGNGVTLTAIRESTLRFEAGYEGIVSVFSAGELAEGVTLRGLKYPLFDAVITNDITIGVSNEFTGPETFISVKKGVLLVSWLGNPDKPLPEICF